MIEYDWTTLDRFAFTDPAGGKQHLKRIRALQAIVVVATDHLRRVFVLHCWSGKLPTSRYLDKLIAICDNYSPRIFGIEANAMQSLFADLVHSETKRRLGEAKNRFMPITQPTKIDKNFRIRTTLEPVINESRLFIPPTMTELMADLRGFPTVQFVDRVDCLASAVALIPARPTVQQRSSEADALAAHLRETGAPSWYIEKRIKETGG